MKAVLNSRRHHYVARVSIFLIIVALVVEMTGCGGDGDGGVTYTLTISNTAGGSVTTPGEGTFIYDEGKVVNLVATPDGCYYFVNWTGDTGTIADADAATTTITMNGDYDITANFEEGETVTFPDPNLEAAIRETIGKPTGPIYFSDLDGLTSLPTEEKNIADLTGLECATNLMELHLYGNQISDISPLANLTSLTSLIVSYNQISDISSLVDNEGLSTGDEVYLSGNPLSSDSIQIYIP